MAYKHLSYYERVEIEFLDRRGVGVSKIAWKLGRSAGAVSRELSRNRDARGKYVAFKAQMNYLARQRNSGRKAVLDNAQLRDEVNTKLRQQFSPEQIAGRLALEYPNTASMRVSHESIYRYVYKDKRQGGDLYMHLRQGHKQRRKRLNSRAKRGTIKDRVPIAERPKIVDEQARIGDFEADTLFGRKSDPPVMTANDRRTLFTVAQKMKDKSAEALNAAFLKALDTLPEASVHTLTVDNGKEFSAFKALQKQAHIDVYFARTYTATDRAINENINGLLRQYLPKGSDFGSLTQERLNEIVDRLNNRPRKKLSYRTPKEAFFGCDVALKD